jgi:hypothetical protein
MRKLVLVVCVLFAFSVSSRTEASTLVDIGTMTLVVPQNGTIELGGPIPSGSQGTFEIIGNPSFSGTGFAVLDRTAVINGASYDILSALGTCPPDACHGLPFVTDTLNGPHVGSTGLSIFPISNFDPTLNISSNWSLLFVQGNIAVPADYQVEVALSLPAGVSAIPEPSTWVMLIIGFVGIGAIAYRQALDTAPASLAHRARANQKVNWRGRAAFLLEKICHFLCNQLPSLGPLAIFEPPPKQVLARALQ